MFPESGDRKELARYLALSQVGLEMVAPALVGLVLDRYFGWTPWGVISGAVLGVITSLVHLVHLTNQADGNRDSSSGKPPS